MKHTGKIKPITYTVLFVLFALVFARHLIKKDVYKYPTGNAFRSLAHHVFDEGKKKKFDPKKVKKGHIIFVKTDYLDYFFLHLHPQIQHPYLLITHNSDHPSPGPFSNYLSDHKMIAWFAQNVEGPSHPKLHPIPIGIANSKWKHGNVKVFDIVVKSLPTLKKRDLLYLNFSPSTFLKERSYVYDLFVSKPFVKQQSNLDVQEYLQAIATSKFILSPRGNGIDCHRTWEALLMGSIPIVKTSSLDPLYEGLPVLIVKEWNEITQEMLEREYSLIKNGNYSCEKLYFPYWKKLIQTYPR